MRKIALIIGMLLLLCTCTPFDQWAPTSQAVQAPGVDPLKDILKRKELRVIIDYNSINYFVYNGEPMGFQYEVLKALANKMDVTLKIEVSNNIDESFLLLEKGQYDLIAKNLGVNGERRKKVEFTEALAITKQVLVQKKPFHKNSSVKKQVNREFITDPHALAGKTVYVPRNSVFAHRIHNLSEETGVHINVLELPEISQEQLIELVATDQIEYTVCHEMVAKVSQLYHGEIDISVPISLDQKISWAVSKEANEWLAYLDQWIRAYRETNEYRQIYQKYFNNSDFHNFTNNGFHSNRSGTISKYDDLIREWAQKYNWDWRLIASVVMQESKFQSDAESWMGAAGLMQLMPQTADRYQVSDVVDPNENLRGGIEHLCWIDEVLKTDIEEDSERLFFVLAAYNVGLGHVIDARKLAEKYGKNPSVWKGHVDFFLRNKSDKKYYLDPVVKHGYCRGEEPYRYVNQVIERYHHYVNVLPYESEMPDSTPWPALQASLR